MTEWERPCGCVLRSLRSDVMQVESTASRYKQQQVKGLRCHQCHRICTRPRLAHLLTRCHLSVPMCFCRMKNASTGIFEYCCQNLSLLSEKPAARHWRMHRQISDAKQRRRMLNIPGRRDETLPKRITTDKFLIRN